VRAPPLLLVPLLLLLLVVVVLLLKEIVSAACLDSKKWKGVPGYMGGGTGVCYWFPIGD
jgi:hypothetical protein